MLRRARCWKSFVRVGLHSRFFRRDRQRWSGKDQLQTQKEKGRLLAPSLQFRKAATTGPSPGREKPATTGLASWLAIRVALPREGISLTGLRVAHHSASPWILPCCAPFRTCRSRSLSAPCIARQTFACRAAQDSDDRLALTP